MTALIFASGLLFGTTIALLITGFASEILFLFLPAIAFLIGGVLMEYNNK